MQDMEVNSENVNLLFKVKDIINNMQNLNNFITETKETKESLKLVVCTTRILHTGISTLKEKASAIEFHEKTAAESLNNFKKHITDIKLQTR